MRCDVDAGGVAAEWIEATAASPGQATLVWFAEPARDRHVGAASRHRAAHLAFATGARVLLVGGPAPRTPHRLAVEDGVAAWSWLLGEGCDSRVTAFVSSRAGCARAV